MNKCVIFGAGTTGKKLFSLLKQKESNEIMFFSDNNPDLIGNFVNGVEVVSPQVLSSLIFDTIYIACISDIEGITVQIENLGLKDYVKVDSSFVKVPLKLRYNFLEKFCKEFVSNNQEICVAEGGVFKGNFAKDIFNLFKPNRMYLFDTFNGFDLRDCNGIDSPHSAGHLNLFNDSTNLSFLAKQSGVIFCRGYFPETVSEVPEEIFSFVHLDFDLFNPTVEGLLYFSRRLHSNGLIMIHDFYNESYPGVKLAVEQFLLENQNFQSVDVGDNLSVALKFK